MKMRLRYLFTSATALAATLNGLKLDPRANAPVQPFSLPTSDKDPKARAEAIEAKRQGILYGTGPDQNFTAYPAGPLGDVIWKNDLVNLYAEQEPHTKLVYQDVSKALEALQKAGGLRSLKDYSVLYDDQWKASMGDLVDMSYFRNYTQDLFFSMQRLTINPFDLRRLHAHERLPFEVRDDVARNVSTLTVEQLHEQGRLFHVDYKHLARIQQLPGRFSAACEAYFYIHPRSGDFLPLAIKPRVNSTLVYTPADMPGDWLFAKILFGQNDVWVTPWRHFASTHLVVELPYLAAQRCMGDNHPILGILKRRVMLNAFALRQFIQMKLYMPGQFVDQLFPFSGQSAKEFTMSLYKNGDNKFRKNYFPRRLQRQGLLGDESGPRLKHFAFAEDATRIVSALRSFMKAFVESYYKEEGSLTSDGELACWLREAKTAGSVDFPRRPGHVTKKGLVEALTHMAYLGAVQHQALNNNDQFINALLPMSPMSLYKPLPDEKGLSEDDIIAFLPNATQSVGQLAIAAAFSRPEFVGSNRSLLKTFSDTELLSSLNDETRAAAADFEAAMTTLSHEIGGLTFDANGLCRGAPFKWQSLDPKIALYAMSI